MLLDFEGVRPQIGENVFVAPNAVVIGSVKIGAGSSVWFGAVLRGDIGEIVIGRESNVQDNAVIHTTAEMPTIIGDQVTIGHGAILEACRIHDGALIGMGSVVLNGSVVEEGAFLAAGSVVKEQSVIRGGHLSAGIPAVVKKQLAGSSAAWVEKSAAEYLQMAHRHLLNARRAGSRLQGPEFV